MAMRERRACRIDRGRGCWPIGADVWGWTMKTLAMVAALTGLAGLALAAAKPVPAIDDKAFQAEILAVHNKERAAVGVAPLAWSEALARNAQDWAQELAAGDRMQHSSQSSEGENLSMAGAGRETPTAMMQRWVAEKANFLPGRAHPNTSRTGNWPDVSHYTAMIWSSTTQVGCAIGRSGSRDYLVCRYSPQGNVRGTAPY